MTCSLALSKLRGEINMEKFFVLRTVTDQSLAERICESFEDETIPVLLEHVTLSEGVDSVSGFRILVPSQHTQHALGLVENIENHYYSRNSEALASVAVH